MNTKYNIAQDSRGYFAFCGKFRRCKTLSGMMYRLTISEQVEPHFVYSTNVPMVDYVSQKPKKIPEYLYQQIKEQALKIQKQIDLQKTTMKSVYVLFGAHGEPLQTLNIKH